MKTNNASRGVVLPAMILLCMAASIAGCSTSNRASERASSAPNTLTPAEAADGWRLLFDGRSFSGWRGLGREDVPSGHWIVENGAIRKVASGDVPTAPDGQPLEGGDLITLDTFGDYELYFEWKVSPGANSGVKYNVSEEMSLANPPTYAALGFEYQVLDDERHPDAMNGPNRTSGALYDLIPPNSSKKLRAPGEYNSSRIVFNRNHGEHWLNGDLILAFDLETPEFDALLERSKYRDIDGFADRRNGHIVLQDHGDDVWYRNIKVRVL